MYHTNTNKQVLLRLFIKYFNRILQSIKPPRDIDLFFCSAIEKVRRSGMDRFRGSLVGEW